MNYKTIPNTDLKISSIALGTWVFGGDMWGGAKESDCMDAVSAAVDHGINLIDTAPIYGYGLAEDIVGRAIKGRRDKFLIATKCGLVGRGKNITNNLTPSSIKREVEESLRRLQIDAIDIYQCHWPDPRTPIEQTLKAMCKLKEQGKIKHIGVSNFDADLLREAVGFTQIVTLQNQYSLLERSIEESILPLTREKGVGVISYGPLAGGILSGKYNVQPGFKGMDARSFFYKYYQGQEFVKTKALLETLKGFGRPLNQIAINWVRQQKGVTSVIVGCRNARQVRQNVLSAAWELSEEQLQKIRTIFP
jgi:aryl-alcohol dehydrogenase-like predicted oxidoreductase